MSKRIVFMGTPEFAVRSLELLSGAGFEIAAVVTVPDKPAGRGQQISMSAVKKFALEKGFTVLQPEKLKDENFLNSLQNLQADLFVVVAFRMLPEAVWNMPPKGTINLHASLLPQYRGAAPINWAVINGDTETGATTFFIEREIDTGKIIDRVKIPINPTDTAGTVHDKLMEEGAILLVKTVEDIFANNIRPVEQQILIHGDLKPAPKIFKEDCQIDWTQPAQQCYNKIRGLSPYPGAFTTISNGEETKTLKIFSSVLHEDNKADIKRIEQTGTSVRIGAQRGWLEITDLQLEGRKRMKTAEFLNGFNISGWQIC
ncbi:MAG: methionyl-tRNA formyltransferase [Crocinitomicaceae bacterium]|nr:methionyl-tRNA formyltransferase [Crocinitomicaceae bacterium]MBK8924906.1 methionyl-tRNA formyltransferase [Crocinitomicaceae bacterium]